MAATVAAAWSTRSGSVPIPPTPTAPVSGATHGDRPRQLGVSLAEQLRALGRVCRDAGTAITSVKAHGALYEEVAKGGALRDLPRCRA